MPRVATKMMPRKGHSDKDHRRNEELEEEINEYRTMKGKSQSNDVDLPYPAFATSNLIKPDVSYRPGVLNTVEHGLLLSEGLTAKMIAVSGDPVQYADGSQSQRPFHYLPDGGAAFPDTRDWNVGGWMYASNSEIKEAKGDLRSSEWAGRETSPQHSRETCGPAGALPGGRVKKLG